MLHGSSGKKQKFIVQLRISLLCQHPLKHYRVYSPLFLMPLFLCYCLTLPMDVASSRRFSLSGQETSYRFLILQRVWLQLWFLILVCTIPRALILCWVATL